MNHLHESGARIMDGRPVHNNQGRTTIANWSHLPLSCQRLSVQETTCTVEGKPWPDYYNKLHFDCQSEWHQCNDQQLFGNPFPWMQHYPASINHAYKVGETSEEHVLGVLIKGWWGTLQLPFAVWFREATSSDDSDGKQQITIFLRHKMRENYLLAVCCWT